VTRPALWLAARELVVRRRRVALAGAVIAALAATVMAMELVARAREEAVAAQIDAMGPALTVVPRGMSAGALARYELGEGALPAEVEESVRAALGSELRAVERRLVVHREVAGARVAVVGVEASAPSTPAQEHGSVVLGAELARRLGGAPSVVVDGRELRVNGVLPSAGNVEDVAVFLPLAEARALAGVQGVNELRLFLRAGVSPREVEARLARASLGVAVIRSDRGEVADREAQESLSRHRGVGYAVMGAVAALCLLIDAHLDASERRVEIATLVAIGASRWTVLGALLFRSSIVASSGAAIGAALGAVLAVMQDPGAAGALGRASSLGLATVGAALVVGIIAATPTALVTLARDPVGELQES
jgi:putative ABC transport system permease protein